MQTSADQILGERWQLIDRIGQGAMGEVWRGRHLVLGHEVAIKIMRPDAAHDPDLAARFRREARIAAQLRHRSLVRVEDFGAMPDGRPFLVMEFLRGQALSAILKQTPKPDGATIARVAQHIGSACDIAHAAGIVHRDLKPDNCFVVTDEDGSFIVKVLDFGIAKVSDGAFSTSSGVVTNSHALMGTPIYMSPEQARGQRDLDGRSDLWSLAMIVYQMLTARLPYSATSIAQLIYSVLAAPIPPPSQVEPALGTALDGWVARALDRDRTHRFQSGRELSSALASALGVYLPGGTVPPPSLAPNEPISFPSAPSSTAYTGPSTPPGAFATYALPDPNAVVAQTHSRNAHPPATLASAPTMPLPPTLAMPMVPPVDGEQYRSPSPSRVDSVSHIALTPPTNFSHPSSIGPPVQGNRPYRYTWLLVVAGVLAGMIMMLIAMRGHRHHPHQVSAVAPTQIPETHLNPTPP